MLEFFCKLFWIKCINADGAKIAVLGECGDNRDTILQQLEVGGLFADQSFRARRSLIDYVIDVRRILVFRKLSVFSRCKALCLFTFIFLLNPRFVVTWLYFASTVHLLDGLNSFRGRVVCIQIGLGHYVDNAFGAKVRWSEFRLKKFVVMGAFTKNFVERATEGACVPIVVGSMNLEAFLCNRRGLQSTLGVQTCDPKHIKVEDRSFDYDICIVSNLKPTYPGYEKHQEFISHFFAANELQGLNIAVAGRYESADPMSEVERDTWTRLIPSLSHFASREKLSSYELCDRSKVVMGEYTTLLVEMLSYGKRIFHYNLSGDPCLDFPSTDRWSFDESKPDDPVELFQAIFNSSDEEWRSLSSEIGGHLISINGERHAEVLRTAVFRSAQ